MPRHATLLLALLVGSGCYTYSETSLADVRPGTSVRVRVSGDEADRLAELTGSDDRVVPGTLVRQDNGSLLLDTPVIGDDPLQGGSALVQRVEIPVAQVREVELRRLDRVRTAAFVGAVAAAAIGVVAWQIGDGNANDDVPPVDNPERRRGPVVVLRLPFGF